ncbi:MAG: FtsX-like permease family protein [Candidatus Cloacimonetes bacterium]|nr:FtsX-like permease family protein [Candidatus Cloacimonadota bacterium]
MLRFLFKGVFRDRHRYLFPLIIVATGVFIILFFQAFLRGYMGSFIRQTSGFETGHLKVVTRAYADLISQKPFDLGFLGVQEDLENWKQAHPQLDWAQRIHFGALLDVPDANGETREQGEIAGFAIDMFGSAEERQRMGLEKGLVSGKIPEQPGEILLSDQALKRLKLRLGDPVTLIGSDVYGSLSMAGFTVSGSVSFGVEALDRGAVIADISDIRAMLNMPGGASEILAFLKDGEYDSARVVAIRDSFNQRFSQAGDEFSPLMLTMGEQNELGLLISMMESVFGIMSFIFIFILGIVLWNAGLMNGIRRYGEFGVRLAVGESKRHLYATLILEAVIIGVVGSLIGVLLGVAGLWYFNIHGLDVSVFARTTTLMTEDIVYTELRLADALASLVPGVLATLLGAALAGRAIFSRQTSQLFKELET